MRSAVKASMGRMLPLIVLLAITPATFAIDTAPAFDDPAQQARYQSLTRQFRCPKCRNETIADSAIPVSADLRRQVRELMQAGKSDDEIRKYMTDRFGDYLLYKPPVNSQTWLLWAAPVLLVLGGGIAAGMVIARKSRLPDDEPDPQTGVS